MFNVWYKKYETKIDFDLLYMLVTIILYNTEKNIVIFLDLH